MKRFEGMKKLLSLALCLCLALGMVPMSALAAEGEACTSTEGCTGVYAEGVCSACGQAAPGQDDPAQNTPDPEESQQEIPNPEESQQETPNPEESQQENPNQNESQQETPAPEESETDAAVAAAQALIDALPDVESVRAMSYDGKVALYNGAYMTAGNAYGALTQEQQAEADAAKLMALAAFYADPSNLTTADENAKEYDIRVAGVQVTSANAADILKDGGTVSYDPESDTLTLNSATIQAENVNGILSESSLTINGIGTNNSITANTGIFAESGDITITGNIGSITATAYHGIYAKDGNISINGSVGDISATTEGQGHGIKASGDINISGTTGDINAYGSGIHSENGNINITGSVGNVSSEKYGAIITNAGNITITGTVGTLSSTESWGIRAKKNIEIGGDTVVNAAGASGIKTEAGKITNNGTLKLPENYKISSLTSENYSGSGIVMVGTEQYIMYNDKWHAYADGSNGIKIESTTPDTYYKAGDGFAVYDKTANTLTLKNATINVSNKPAINTDVDLTIIGNGTNAVTATGGSAIYSKENSITIQGTIDTIQSDVYNGIYAKGGTLTLTGTINSIEGAVGICAKDLSITDTGTVKAVKGNVNVGIYVVNSATVSGRVDSVTGNKAGFYSEQGNITINGKIGTAAATLWSGIAAEEGNITISGTVGLATGTNAINAPKGSVSVSDTGTVTAVGTSAGVNPLNDSKMNGNALVVSGGNAAVYGTYSMDSYDGAQSFGTLKVNAGATLTIPAGETVTVTTDLTNNGKIVNNGTLVLPEGYDLNANLTKDNYSGSGIVMVGEQQYIMYNDKWYAYADGSGGIKIESTTPDTYYKAGEGFAIYEKDTGTLTLNNAAISTTNKEGIYKTDTSKLKIVLNGTNSITTGRYTAVHSQGDLEISGETLIIKSDYLGISSRGTASINIKKLDIVCEKYGIRANGDLTIDSSDVKIENKEEHGIVAFGANIKISGSKVTVNSAGGEAIYTSTGDQGDIVISNSEVNAYSAKSSAIASAWHDLKISGNSHVIAKTGASKAVANPVANGYWRTEEDGTFCGGRYTPADTHTYFESYWTDDKTSPVITGITDGATYYTTQKATATDTYLSFVTKNTTEITPVVPTGTEVTLEGNQDTSYTVKAEDAAGNKTSVTITMKPISTLDDPIKNLTVDNVELTDKDAIQAVLDVVTPIRENECGNATQAEKDALDAIIRKCNDLLGVIGAVEDVIDQIQKLPDPSTIQPYDETVIDAYEKAQDAYDKLSDHGKELVGEENKAKLDAVHTALTAYKITKGHKSSYVKGSYKTLTFTANGPVSKFSYIEVDGKQVDAKYYTVASDNGTVITLKASYLEILSAGKHTIQVNYVDGNTGGEDYFRITINNGNPITGDDNHMLLFIGVAMASLLCMAIAVLFFPRRKGKYQR